MDQKSSKFWQDRLKRPPNNFEPGDPESPLFARERAKTAVTAAHSPRNKNITLGWRKSPTPHISTSMLAEANAAEVAAENNINGTSGEQGGRSGGTPAAARVNSLSRTAGGGVGSSVSTPIRQRPQQAAPLMSHGQSSPSRVGVAAQRHPRQLREASPRVHEHHQPPPLLWWLDCMQTLAFALAEGLVETGDAIVDRPDAGQAALLEQLKGAHERLKLDLSKASLAGRDEASFLTTSSAHVSPHPHHSSSSVNTSLHEPFQLPVAANNGTSTPPPATVGRSSSSPPLSCAAGPPMDGSVPAIDFPPRISRSSSPGVAPTALPHAVRSSSVATTTTTVRGAVRLSSDPHHHALSSDAQRLQLRVDRELEGFSTLCEKLIRRCAAATKLHAATAASAKSEHDHNLPSHAGNRAGISLDAPSASFQLVGDDDAPHSLGSSSATHPHKDKRLVHILRDRTGELEAALMEERSKTAALRQELRLLTNRGDLNEGECANQLLYTPTPQSQADKSTMVDEADLLLVGSGKKRTSVVSMGAVSSIRQEQDTHDFTGLECESEGHYSSSDDDMPPPTCRQQSPIPKRFTMPTSTVLFSAPAAAVANPHGPLKPVVDVYMSPAGSPNRHDNMSANMGSPPAVKSNRGYSEVSSHSDGSDQQSPARAHVSAARERSDVGGSSRNLVGPLLVGLPPPPVLHNQLSVAPPAAVSTKVDPSSAAAASSPNRRPPPRDALHTSPLGGGGPFATTPVVEEVAESVTMTNGSFSSKRFGSVRRAVAGVSSPQHGVAPVEGDGEGGSPAGVDRETTYFASNWGSTRNLLMAPSPSPSQQRPTTPLHVMSPIARPARAPPERCKTPSTPQTPQGPSGTARSATPQRAPPKQRPTVPTPNSHVPLTPTVVEAAGSGLVSGRVDAPGTAEAPRDESLQLPQLLQAAADVPPLHKSPEGAAKAAPPSPLQCASSPTHSPRAVTPLRPPSSRPLSLANSPMLAPSFAASSLAINRCPDGVSSPPRGAALPTRAMPPPLRLSPSTSHVKSEAVGEAVGETLVADVPPVVASSAHGIDYSVEAKGAVRELNTHGSTSPPRNAVSSSSDVMTHGKNVTVEKSSPSSNGVRIASPPQTVPSKSSPPLLHHRQTPRVDVGAIQPSKTVLPLDRSDSFSGAPDSYSASDNGTPHRATGGDRRTANMVHTSNTSQTRNQGMLSATKRQQLRSPNRVRPDGIPHSPPRGFSSNASVPPFVSSTQQATSIFDFHSSPTRAVETPNRRSQQLGSGLITPDPPASSKRNLGLVSSGRARRRRAPDSAIRPTITGQSQTNSNEASDTTTLIGREYLVGGLTTVSPAQQGTAVLSPSGVAAASRGSLVSPLPSWMRPVQALRTASPYSSANGQAVVLPFTTDDELDVVSVPLTGALGDAIFDPSEHAIPHRATTPVRTITTNMAAAKLIYHLQCTGGDTHTNSRGGVVTATTPLRKMPVPLGDVLSPPSRASTAPSVTKPGIHGGDRHRRSHQHNSPAPTLEEELRRRLAKTAERTPPHNTIFDFRE